MAEKYEISISVICFYGKVVGKDFGGKGNSYHKIFDAELSYICYGNIRHQVRGSPIFFRWFPFQGSFTTRGLKYEAKT